MRVVSVQEMKDIERKAAEGGLSYYQMMENAGSAAVDVICKKLSSGARDILVIVGKGNNGGDGYVIARLLCKRGYKAVILQPDGEPCTEDAIKNCELCREMNIEFMPFESGTSAESLKGFALIVDALYGTGFHGEFRERAARIAAAVNESGVAVAAVDIPSGVNGDTGAADTNAIRANYTVVMHSLKTAHTKNNVKDICGEIICVDIGIAE